MALFSLFSRRAEISRAPAAEPLTPPTRERQTPFLWRCGVFDSYAAGENVQAVHRANETPRLYPAFAVEFVSSCAEWRTLDRHVAHYAERHGWDTLQIDALRNLLPDLCDEGLLVSTQQVLEKLSTNPGGTPPPAISAIGFPTGGNRVDVLERALRSFSANLRTHGRTADLLIADSSGDPEQSRGFRNRLAELRKDLAQPLLFCAAEEKQAFVDELVRMNACSREAAEFALLDPLGTGFACGANRNAILLHGAGRMICSVDDDVVCRLSRRAEASEDGLAFFSNADPFSRWLYPDRDSATREAEALDADFLAVHEKLLGRDMAELLRDRRPQDCDFTKAKEPFLIRAGASDPRIRSTFLGHLGDPGIPTSVYFLFFDGENRRRLTESEQHYRAVFGRRSVQALVMQPALGDASISPGMAMGMDHREILPPFFPVLHAEDFSWGAAVWQCCGSAMLGHLPVAAEHSPPSIKPILTPADFGPNRRVVIFEWAHLLRFLIFGFEPASDRSDAEQIMALGREFSGLAALAPRDFDAKLAKVILGNECGRLQWLERQLREDDESPDFWRDDVQAHLDHVRESLMHSDFDIPLDLKHGREPAQARRFMQSLLGRYGQLLQEWPDIVQAAATLRDAGISLFQRIE